MDKKQRQLIKDELFKRLCDYYFPRGFSKVDKLQHFNLNQVTITWGANAEDNIRIHYQPFITINYQEIIDKLRTFSQEINIGSNIVKAVTFELAQELDIHDFDKSKYRNQSYHAYKIWLDEEIEPQINDIVNEHIKLMEKAGWSFIEKVNTLEKLAKFLTNKIIDLDIAPYNEETKKSNFQAKNYLDRGHIISGTIAAYLCKYDNLDFIMGKYIAFAEKIKSDYTLKDYYKVVDYIKNNPL
jgi:hypothetical protein